MTRHLAPFILLMAFMVQTAASQDRTIEKRTVRDTTGQVVVVENIETISSTEDITPRAHMLTINPLKFFLFYNLTYYQKISSVTALGFGLQIPTLSGLDGVGGNLEARFYPSEKTLRGFYVAPNLSYNALKSGGESADIFSFGALVGWQWFPGDDFAIGLGIGLDYYSASSSAEDFEDYKGTAPSLRFDIGYAW